MFKNVLQKIYWTVKTLARVSSRHTVLKKGRRRKRRIVLKSLRKARPTRRFQKVGSWIQTADTMVHWRTR